MKFLVKRTPDNFIKTVNDEISSILNRHFDHIYPDYAYQEDMDKLSIPLEVTENEKEYEILAELPGIEKENLDIDVEKNYITINAKKEERICKDEKTFKKTEFNYGEFSRSVYLPIDIDVDNANAKMDNGILKIQVPKLHKDSDNIKKIKVQ